MYVFIPVSQFMVPTFLKIKIISYADVQWFQCCSNSSINIPTNKNNNLKP